MLRIEDYALIGDCETAALVGRNGSIDWLCWPRFDSAACFTALLGSEAHGRWLLAPRTTEQVVTRRYRANTLVLETDFVTPEGAVRIIDFMPMRRATSDLVRIVVGLEGAVTMCCELVLRFDYGSAVPWLTLLNGSVVRAVAGPDKVILHAGTPIRVEDASAIADFTVASGEKVSFVLCHGPSHTADPEPLDAYEALAATEEFWRTWCARCTYRGEWSEAVTRSLVTLKALTYAPTGGLVAAPTTSLPERIGGLRNWDYRYCWLRDATMTLLALLDAGYHDEARAWRDWLLRAVAGRPARIQIMYGLAGERRLPETHLDWLPGYEGSVPVRIGNAAATQMQLDVYGELMDALHQARGSGLGTSEPGWAMQKALVEHLSAVWEQPDEGIWEVRSGRRHFTHSKVMAWVALDRTIRSAEQFGLAGPVESWRALRGRIHHQVCNEGYDPSRGVFVQSYGSQALDASLLLLPLVGFLPASDARMRRTVAAIEQHLNVDGYVLRYHTAETNDGLPTGEGAFLACSFWLVDNLVLQSRTEEARRLFERLLSLRNDVGLLAEEYDPVQRRQLGNFPQALSHLALVGSALNFARGDKPIEQRPGAPDSPRVEPAH